MIRARGWAGAFFILMLIGFVGCTSDRIDPPSDDEAMTEGESGQADSLVVWAKRVREGWASGDPMRADAAAALARESFSAAWEDAANDREALAQGVRSERLPVAADAGIPAPSSVENRLSAVGLQARTEVAEGSDVVWQVVLSDPLGTAGALTEFWAWPDPQSPSGPPILQTLPGDAPSIARYGPEAAGRLATFREGDRTGLASAWARPRGRGGLEVALARRSKGGARFAVRSNEVLPVAVDSLDFRAGPPPLLLVKGAGARDPLFDDCPTCPRLVREQRYRFQDKSWVLADERIGQSPYSAFVSFLHAVSTGTPEGALPYSAGPAVVEQAKLLGLDVPSRGPLRAAPGTEAGDLTQFYRRSDGGQGEAIEVTLERRGTGWVVSDLRATRVVIE